MKITYLSPLTEVVWLITKEGVLKVSGEDLTSRSYGSKDGEDDDCFWE